MTTAERHAGRTARLTRATLCMAALLSALALSGCGASLSPQLPYAKLAVPYAVAQVGRTTSLEVLNVARDPAYQFDPADVDQVLLTQGDTVVGFSGRSEDERKTWLNLIAFDEFRMTARRKYFFCIDERAAGRRWPLFPPPKALLFDAEFLIDPEVLTTPYATQEAQLIAILQWLAAQFQRDLVTLIGNPADPAQGSETIVQAGGMVRQVFQGVLVQLDRSPGLAKNLADERGIAFPHMSLDEGRIRLLTQNDYAAVKVRINLPMAESK